MNLSDLEIQEAEALHKPIEEDVLGFNKLKHNYFKEFLNYRKSYVDILKIGSRQVALQLPENIEEFFLIKEDTPVFWLLETPLLIACERLINEDQNNLDKLNQVEVKRNFTKWAITADQNQKRIFASVLIKIVNGQIQSKTFIDLIYYSLILIFDKSFKNPTKALEELFNSRILVDEMVKDDELKKKLLYIIQLYRGYALIILQNYEEASKELSFAIDYNSKGINAKFYYAYLSALLSRKDFTEALIKEIFSFDIERMKFAINSSSIVMFNFFLNTPVSSNIFLYNEFANYAEFIGLNVIDTAFDSRGIIKLLITKLNDFKKLEFDEYYTEEARQTIKFLHDIDDQHSNNKSIYLNLIAMDIKNIFNALLDKIQNKIKERFYENYNHVMVLYQNSIEENEKLIDHYSKEVEDIKSNLQKKLSQSIKQIEDYVKDALWEVEEKKKSINYLTKFDPVASFRSSMSYNVFVSIIVFIIGGMAGYFNNSGFFENGFYMMISKILITGLKWSALTFIVGFIISVFVSGLVFFDKSNEKQNLEKQSFELQKQKELSINMLKKEAEQKQKTLSEGYLERIEAKKNKIKELQLEKEQKAPILIEQAENEIKPFREKLSPLYLN